MNKLIILFFIAISFSWSSMLDFKYLDDAKKAYESKEYEKAANSYSKVEIDEAKFNEANSLYKAKKYEEALKNYSSISNKNLEFDKLYNMGNSYANLKDNDKAIESYEEALKIKDDGDAKYNLELLKKKKEEQNKNQDNKQENKSDKNKQNDESKKENSQQQNQQNQQNKEEKQKQENQQNSKNEEKNEQQEKKQAQEMPQKEQAISNMEERKWQKLLNDREINTLLLPLTKGDNNEKQPW